MMLTLLARGNVKAFSQKEKRKGKAVSSVVVLLAAENTRHKQPWQGRGYFLFRGFDLNGGQIHSDGHSVADSRTVAVGHRVDIHAVAGPQGLLTPQ